MTPLQTYVAKSRYARYLDDKKRREHWPETVKRYFDFMQKHLKKKHNYDIPTELRDEIKKAIVNLEVMPSMRAIMTAGEALERQNVASYNCFSGDTKFVTKDGLKTFQECVGKTVEVLAGDGEWRPATIEQFGYQRVQTIEFRPGVHSRTQLRYRVQATANHRWITKRGETTDIQQGDVVPFQSAPQDEFSVEDFVRGFGYGDGTIDARGNARIRLCGDKAKYLPYFEQVGASVTYSPSANGDPLVCFSGKRFSDWKRLPDNPSRSWFDGWFAADGHFALAQPGVSTQDFDAAKLLVDNAPYAGVVVTGWNSIDNATNYGPRHSPLNRLTFRDTTEFVVTAITQHDELVPVYCAVEPVTHAFTLAGGILTGNCSYLPIDDTKAFDEAMYILLCGTGVGFSVEQKYVSKLPEVPDRLFDSKTTIVVKDSKEGWAKALRQLVALLYAGEIPKWDVSAVRPAGARLKTFGGRASGPGPLVDLFTYVVNKFKGAVGRKLNSIEAHDIMCKIGEVVVVGGVRRSAMISLSDLSDDNMARAKAGNWWDGNVQRALANNSAVYDTRPSVGQFMREWSSIYESHSGERGIFNRYASEKQAAKNGRRNVSKEYGTNPLIAAA